MIRKRNLNGLTWIDIESPTPADIKTVIDEYSLPPEPAEDILSPTPRQRVVRYANCVYIVLHFPTLSFHKNSIKGDTHRKEIDFIVGNNFLITVHYDSMTAIKKFNESLEGMEVASDENAGFIFHKLVKHLYRCLLHDVEVIKTSLHKAENSIFAGEEKAMVVELSMIHRDILRFNNALLPHREAIEMLRSVFKTFFGERYEHIIHDMKSEYERVDRRMNNNKALLDELRYTNDSLLSAKQNEAIKGLTMMAFVTFPLMLIAAIFAMDTKDMPIVGLPNDFWIVISIMVMVAIGCMIYFSNKRWL